MSIAKQHYLKKMAEQGAQRHALGLTSLELVATWILSDTQTKPDVGKNLINEFYKILTQVWGWQPYEAKAAARELSRAFREVGND